MKSDGLSETSVLESERLYSRSNALRRVNFEQMEESDADDYYPFVMGHGSNCRVIDPKVYKQLRRHNIQSRRSVKIAECAKKNCPNGGPQVSSTKERGVCADDEYCKLSPLAKGPTLAPSLSSTGSVDLKRLPSFERRFFSDYSSKVSVVEGNRSSPAGTVTKLVSPADSANAVRRTDCEGYAERRKKQYCGMEADELIDCATCMCCAKGLLYHCTKDIEEEGGYGGNPCSCGGPISRCGPRWLLLSALSIFLPCLWCYLPIAGCRKATSKTSTKRKKTEKSNVKPTRKG